MKLREYKVGEVFAIGRGLFIAHEADPKYWPKHVYSDVIADYCWSCCFNRGRGACNILACSPQSRKDNKDVVFERL